MARCHFFNLRSPETEHCLAWLVGSGLDVEELVDQVWAEAAAEVDANPESRAWVRQDPRHREEAIAEAMVGRLVNALRNLLQGRLGAFSPELLTYPPLNYGDSTTADPKALIGGLVAHAWNRVDLRALAGALRRHVRCEAMGEGDGVEDPSVCPLCDRALGADSPLCGLCEGHLDRARARLTLAQRDHPSPTPTDQAHRS